jgi:hypothetical protein
MRKPLLFALACALFACSDGKASGTHTQSHDAGDETVSDGGAPGEDDASETKSGLERPPNSLSHPPTSNRLPDDLKPPGFAK